MSQKLFITDYVRLIDEDIVAMCKGMPDSLERRHIIDVLKHSVEALYNGKTYASVKAVIDNLTTAN